LPEYKKQAGALDAGSGLGGVIISHYSQAMFRVGLKVLSSGAAWGEILMTAADSKAERLARQEQKSLEMGDTSKTGFRAGLKSVGRGFLAGLKGTVTKPLEGAKSGGFTGFVNGIGAGAVGAITKPTAGVISGAQQVSRKLRKTEQVFKRVRTPRAVFGDHLLRRFDFENATAYWALQAEEVRLRMEGRNAQADKIYALKHSYFGYAKILDPPAGGGLVISQHKLLLVQGAQFDKIQTELDIKVIKPVSVVGKNASSIQIISAVTDLKKKPLVVRVDSPEKCALVVEIINKLVSDAAGPAPFQTLGPARNTE
jgi:hypothetical protein